MPPDHSRMFASCPTRPGSGPARLHRYHEGPDIRSDHQRRRALPSPTPHRDPTPFAPASVAPLDAVDRPPQRNFSSAITSLQRHTIPTSLVAAPDTRGAVGTPQNGYPGPGRQWASPTFRTSSGPGLRPWSLAPCGRSGPSWLMGGAVPTQLCEYVTTDGWQVPNPLCAVRSPCLGFTGVLLARRRF